jgi:hypothetical protein
MCVRDRVRAIAFAILIHSPLGTRAAAAPARAAHEPSLATSRHDGAIDIDLHQHGTGEGIWTSACRRRFS